MSDKETAPRCPKCSQPLKRVRYPSDSMLNRDQWDSIRAGDWFCECHNNHVGNQPYAYFWEKDLRVAVECTAPAPQPADECLSQARGALSDIATLVTSCVPTDADPKFQEICRSVLNRILCSGDRRRSRPSWFRFDWERVEWEKYESGETKACSYPLIAAKDFEAATLQVTPTGNTLKQEVQNGRDIRPDTKSDLTGGQPSGKRVGASFEGASEQASPTPDK